MHYSGETSYHSNFLGVASQTASSDCLKTFLDGDAIEEVQKHAHRRLSELRKCRQEHTRQRTMILSNVETTMRLLDNNRNHVINETARMVKQSEDSIDRFIQDRDNLLMKIVLKYFSVLVAEKKSHIARVAEEFDASDRKRHHILIDRDFQTFAAAVNPETKGAVEVLLLSRESEQYQRCRKAVKDNTAPDIFNNSRFEGIKVLNVMNVKHPLLAKKLAKHAKRHGDKGKVKGLFCCLSSTGIQSFCAYGLYRQKLLSSTAVTNLNVFRPAWYTCPLPQHFRKLNPDTRMTRSPSSLTKRGGNEDGIKECKAASLAGEQRSQPLLHFSRKISLTNLTMRADRSGSGLASNRGDVGDLPYLALCRVFLRKMYEVDGPITDADVAFAAGSDYDSVHSTECDDYILLNPKCVLPEFVMHVQLEWNNKDQGPMTAPKTSHIPELLCHPSTLYCEEDTSSISSDIVVRDNVVYSGGKQSTVMDQSRNDDLANYLKINEFSAVNRHVSMPSGSVISTDHDQTFSIAVGNKKQALLRDLEYVVNSLDKYIKEILASHATRTKSLVG